MPIERRHFLTHLAAVVAFGSSASNAQSRLRGSRAGDERLFDGIPFCWCPPGRFVMGSPASEPGHRADEAQVEVTLTRGFWTAKHEVTQGLWTRIARAFPNRPPSAELGEGDDVAVYWINFYEAEGFCDELTRRLRRSGELPAGWEVTLPTEAQWEYACRAGTTTATSFGDAFDRSQVNYSGQWDNRRVRSTGMALRAGSYAANPWGIHDMHGNVWEWCRDYFRYGLRGGVDPDGYVAQGPPNRDGSYSRVRRGGAWIEDGWACRSAARLPYESHRRSDHIGFRIFLVER